MDHTSEALGHFLPEPNLSTGHPIGRPEKAESRKIVASNFFACASFFEAYFHAFNHVFMGWDLGAERQHDIHCLFQIILAWAWSYEESRRKGCHAHGIANQLALTVDFLIRLFGNADTRREKQIIIFNFTESMMASHLPNLRPCG